MARRFNNHILQTDPRHLEQVSQNTNSHITGKKSNKLSPFWLQNYKRHLILHNKTRARHKIYRAVAFEPRHVISKNVAFWQVFTQTSLCSLFFSLETPCTLIFIVFQATSKGSDQTAHMRRLVWAFADRTYHIVGNLMSRLIFMLHRLVKINQFYTCYG